MLPPPVLVKPIAPPLCVAVKVDPSWVLYLGRLMERRCLPLHKKSNLDPTYFCTLPDSTGIPVDQILGAYHSWPDRFNQEPVKQ